VIVIYIDIRQGRREALKSISIEIKDEYSDEDLLCIEELTVMN